MERLATDVVEKRVSKVPNRHCRRRQVMRSSIEQERAIDFHCFNDKTLALVPLSIKTIGAVLLASCSLTYSKIVVLRSWKDR
jgi:hypothetical protein